MSQRTPPDASEEADDPVHEEAALWVARLSSADATEADRSAFEDYDAEAAGERGYGFVRLHQLALEHLMGAR